MISVLILWCSTIYTATYVFGHRFNGVEFGNKQYLMISVLILWCSNRNNKILAFLD